MSICFIQPKTHVSSSQNPLFKKRPLQLTHRPGAKSLSCESECANSISATRLQVIHSRLFSLCLRVSCISPPKTQFWSCKVQHRVTGQVMALKMNMLDSNRANMLREVQLMNRLSHPNILRYLCVHEGQLHALTEYINGGNLEQLLGSDVYLSWAVRLGLALDIARGLHYLHSKGFFHRDLTSKNCLVRWEGDLCSAIVADFGLAEKIPDCREDQDLAVVGSPYWMAPEMLRGEVYNEKVDVFAYGIILCEIIARIQADPDIMPRTEDFGLDVPNFKQMVGDCPPDFLELAVSCSCLNVKIRPSFSQIIAELEKRKAERMLKDELAVKGEASNVANRC
uniref:dual-specificity kinase n=1 Tax=Mola mola TaxID=94237 RepID=A0A3Q3X4J4_MOLML